MSAYPSLLNKRAELISSLSRFDLLFLAVGYLILSKLKISGGFIFIFLLLGLVIKKTVEKKINLGFFKFFYSKRVVSWRLK